jgi:beta-lactamase class A
MMEGTENRNMKLTSIVRLGLLCAFACWNAGVGAAQPLENRRTIQEKLAATEAASGGRLGVAMLDVDGSVVAAYRGAERFPMASTFKLMLVAVVLKRSVTEPDLLLRRVAYSKDELIFWSPVTEKHVAEGMRVGELCAAAIEYSDNTAANLLLKLSGGPRGLTAFARSIGDKSFRLDRWEPAMNEALPGDERDTTTPEAMAASLRALAVGDALPAPQRAMLAGWLKGNTTGRESIRAGVPADWVVGDKTGSGGFGTTNDIAVLWPPKGPPLVLVVYFTQHTPDAAMRRDLISAVARLLVGSGVRNRNQVSGIR